MKLNFEKFNKIQKDYYLKSIIPKGFISAMRLNGFSINSSKHYEPKKIYNLIIPSKLGGIINFKSTEKIKKSQLKYLLKHTLITMFYRIKVNSTPKKWFRKPVITNAITYCFGKYVNGDYSSDEGNLFDKNSKSVEIRGISIDDLIEVAFEICDAFNQSQLLIKDNENGNIFTITRNEVANDNTR